MDSKNCAPRCPTCRTRGPKLFLRFNLWKSGWIQTYFILSRHKKHPQKCVSKMMDPKKYPGNGQASLIYFNLEKQWILETFSPQVAKAPATTWMLVADAARSQVPIAGPSLGICPWSVWLLLNPLLSCYTSFQPPAVISGDRITPIYKPP